MNLNRFGRLALPAASLIAVAALLVGCGASSGSDDKSAAFDAPAPASAPMPPGDALGTSGGSTAYGEMADDAAGRDSSADSGESVPAASEPVERAVISTGELQVTTKNPSSVRREALSIVTALGGTVAEEQSSSDDKGRIDAVDLTLRVPVGAFEKALDRLGDLGTLRHRSQSSADVTTKVIDTDARVKAQAASVASIQRLLARAETIGEIMSIENQLASRQAELDSLLGQQKYLKDQTSLATIQLGIIRPEDRPDEDRGGFLGGLEDGWEALGDSAVAVGTALGAVLPFAAVLLVLAIPGRTLLRRRRSAAPAAPAMTTPAPPEG